MECFEGSNATLFPMLIGEARILQVSLFTTLNRSLAALDSTRVLLDVITIADEGGFSVETGNAFASWNLRRHSALRLNVAGYSESRNRLADVSL
jgi:hypothetical protein